MISLKGLLLAVVTAAGAAAASQAAIVRYDFQGEPLFSDGNPASSACGGLVAQPGFSGQVTIDTAVFGPDGPAFSSIVAGDTRTGTVFSYVAGRFDGTRISDAGLADIPLFVSFSGSIGRFLRPGDVGPNRLFLGFDDRGEVAVWNGSDTDGGSTDQYVSNEGDSVGGFGSTASCDEGNICARVPGTWTRTVIDGGAVAPPAPLPAGALLLGGALAVLGARARRRYPRR